MPTITRQHTIDITDEEMWGLLVRWTTVIDADVCRRTKKLNALRKLIVLRENERFIRCPFPFDCNKFPCADLDCSGDECHSGNVFRRS